jgi:hypothetical protein
MSVLKRPTYLIQLFCTENTEITSAGPATVPSETSYYTEKFYLPGCNAV